MKMSKSEINVIDELNRYGSLLKVVKEYNIDFSPVDNKRWIKAVRNLEAAGKVKVQCKIIDQYRDFLEPSIVVVAYRVYPA